MTAIEELKAEHQAVLLTIQILNKISSKLEAGKAVDVTHLDQIVEFLQVFVDKCHHGKEERILFPVMEAAGIPRQGGPIGAMLHEHENGRSFVLGLKSAVEDYREGKEGAIAGIITNATNYGRLLTAHIDKENNVLYVMAQRVLSQDKMDQMLQSFNEIEELEIGPNKHEEFHATLHALRDIYLA